MAVASGRRSIWVKDRPAAVGERSHSIDRMKSQQAMRGGMEERKQENSSDHRNLRTEGGSMCAVHIASAREREKKTLFRR